MSPSFFFPFKIRIIVTMLTTQECYVVVLINLLFLFVYMCVGRCTKVPLEGLALALPWAGIRWLWVSFPWCESWELNSGPLKDQEVLLTTANLTRHCHGVSLLQYFIFFKNGFPDHSVSTAIPCFPPGRAGETVVRPLTKTIFINISIFTLHREICALLCECGRDTLELTSTWIIIHFYMNSPTSCPLDNP